MTSPYEVTNSNYSVSNIYTTTSSTIPTLCTNSTNIYFTLRTGSTTEVWWIDIVGGLNLVTTITNILNSKVPIGMGISPDGVTLIVCLCDSSLSPLSPVMCVISNPSVPLSTSVEYYYNSDPSTNPLIRGNIYIYNTLGFYGVGQDNQNYSVNGIMNVNLNVSTNEFSFTYVYSPTLPNTCVGLSFLPSFSAYGNLYFTIDSANGGSVYYYSQSFDSLYSISPPTSTSVGGNSSYFTVVLTELNQIYLYTLIPNDLITPTNYLLQPYTYTLGNGSATPTSGNFAFGFNPSNGLQSNYYLTSSKSGGSNLLRFYLLSKNGNYQITKLYQTTGGSSTGGDPHIRRVCGDEIKFYDVRRVLLLSTDEYFKNEGIKLSIWCDSFLIRDLDLYPKIKEDISQEQLPTLFVNESYLNNIYIEIEEKGKLSYLREINTITLEMKEGFRFVEKGDSPIVEKGESPIVEKGDSPIVEKGESPSKREEEVLPHSNVESVKLSFSDKITLSNEESEKFKYKSNILSPFKFKVKSYRKGEINIKDVKFNIEVIRTECIHLSDFHISIEGADLDRMSGAIIDGKI